MTKNVIPHEAAEDQAQIFIDYYEVDEEKEVVKLAYPDMVKHIMKGRLEITLDDSDDIVVRQIFKKPINDMADMKYDILAGKHKEQMKSDYKSEYAKIYALLGSLSGGSKMGISRLKGVDLSVAETLGALFLSL